MTKETVSIRLEPEKLGKVERITYRVREAEIQILHVVHGRQQWPDAS